MPEDRATAIGNMHKNLVKIMHVLLGIFLRTDRQTDRHTHTQMYSSQYFANTPVVEVNMQYYINFISKE